MRPLVELEQQAEEEEEGNGMPGPVVPVPVPLLLLLLLLRRLSPFGSIFSTSPSRPVSSFFLPPPLLSSWPMPRFDCEDDVGVSLDSGCNWRLILPTFDNLRRWWWC
jgi:hypothetical protein